jgi:tRNA (mo5U34)-methyltransferase
MADSGETTDRDPLAAIASNPLWYQTIEVAPGVETPGWFDLRPIVHRLPWPDVRGKRCLDAGTYDGFFAFELERRGAAEVVAIDLPDMMSADWPVDARPGVAGADAQLADRGPERGVGFGLVAELTGSRAEWRPLSVYDLSPAEVGTFDVVVLGSLLLHLRDPVRALEAIRSVCDGFLLSSEQIDPWETVLHPRKPAFRFDGSGPDLQWFVPNAAGHERLLWAAGFEVEAASRPYVERLNPVHQPPPGLRPTRRERLVRALLGDPSVPFPPWDVLRYRLIRRMTGDPNPGVLHRCVRARPRL